MSQKLRDYQVLDVLCGGTFYKVRHKVTNNIFAWRAYDCSAYSSEQIQSIVNEVKTINKVQAAALLRLYDTILHAASRTLYFVLELRSWRSLDELLATGAAADKVVAERFIWNLLRELARVCKSIENINLVVLQKCITTASVFVEENGDLRVNCFDLSQNPTEELMRQVGNVVRALCCSANENNHRLKAPCYSDDLLNIVEFLMEERATELRPDVILHHPTVLANLEIFSAPKHLTEILVSADYSHNASQVNLCDSEKAVELSKTVEPAPRTHLKALESPIYCNISPKKYVKENENGNNERGSLSPTIAALALELPGFVPRSRRAISGAMESYNSAQQVSENTLSQQWMSRLIALRQREESLNKRERDLIAKEILNSPAIKIVPLHDSQGIQISSNNGITLPPMISQTAEQNQWVSRRHKRTNSVRLKSRRKTFSYEDLDSSLSADNGDSSMVVTATKFTKENMPRNLFPEVSTKKVHFTPANPFVESDDSVTLTFYELENVDGEGYQVPRQEEKAVKDITKFKYLDVEKVCKEKRSALPWSHSSPSKQAKLGKNIFSDITNTKGNIRKTPSKTSLTSKGSNLSRFSIASGQSQWSEESSMKGPSRGVAERTRASIRLSVAQTPTALDAQRKSRRSLLPFKTPFKFMNSNRI